MDRTITTATLALAAISLFASAGALPTSIPWPNGDFTLGAAGWTPASTTLIGDADADGDNEARFSGCGDGTWQLSRGVSKGVVPANADLAFTVETGQVDAWDFRMIVLDANDPAAYANNLYSLDPTGTLQPDWFDDQVLYWHSWSVPLTGSVVLDPTSASAVNIAGWDAMSAAEREAKLQTMTHMTLVMYGCTAGGATLDDFGFVL